MTDEKSLIVATDLTAVTVFTDEGIKPILEKIKKQVDGVVSDVTTLKGREEVKSRAFKVTRSKTLIKESGQKLIEDDLLKIKKVKSAIKVSDEYLTTLAKDQRQPLTDWEAAEEIRKAEELRLEQERIEKIRVVITGMSDHVISCVGKTSVEIQEVIYSIEDIQVTEEAFAEFKDAAWATKEDTTKKLRDMRDAVQLQEDESVRLEAEKKRLAEEDEARQKKVKEQAAENERVRLANEAAAEKIKKDRDEIDTHLEELTQEPEKAPEAAEAPKKEEIPAEEESDGKVDPVEAAISSLSEHVDEDVAEMVINLIIDGQIANVRFAG